MKIAFYDAKPYDQQYFLQANNDYQFDISFFDTHLNIDTVALCQHHDAVCVFVNDNVDAAVIARLHEYGIRVLALRCAGFNNVDLEAAAANDLTVVRVPSYSPYAVAEHALALIMSLNRHTYHAYQRTREANFSINGLVGFDLHGKTAGVIGTGTIGRCLIPILRGLGMSILLYDKLIDRELERTTGATYVPLDELYLHSDVISLHCPLVDSTFHMIDDTAIQKMKHGVMIINTGRGKLIDSQALVKGLKSGKVGAAGLDVYEEEANYFFEDKSLEPMSDDVLARLLTFPNVLVTSHQGFFTREALENIALTTLQNLQGFFNNAGPIHQIDVTQMPQ